MHKLGTGLALLVIATLFNESKWRYKSKFIDMEKCSWYINWSKQIKNTTEWLNFFNVYMQREKSEMFICCFYFKFSTMIMCHFQSYETNNKK